MKRSAEVQLTKDNADDDVQESEISEDFRKADDKVLASRPMKGLPKRAALRSESPKAKMLGTSNVSLDVKKKDAKLMLTNGFAGFGSGSTAPFTFSAPFSPSSSPSSSSNGKPSTTDSPTTFSESFIKKYTPVSPVPIPTKGTPTLTNGGLASTNNTSTSTNMSDKYNEPSTKYYTSMKALNANFQEKLLDVLRHDPVADLSNFLDQYKQYLQSIKHTLKASQEELKRAESNTRALAVTSDSKSLAVVLAKPSPPTVPTHFKSFVTDSVSKTSGSASSMSSAVVLKSSSRIGPSFIPSLDKPSENPSPFTLGKPSSSSTTPSKQPAEAPKLLTLGSTPESSSIPGEGSTGGPSKLPEPSSATGNLVVALIKKDDKTISPSTAITTESGSDTMSTAKDESETSSARLEASSGPDNTSLSVKSTTVLSSSTALTFGGKPGGSTGGSARLTFGAHSSEAVSKASTPPASSTSSLALTAQGKSDTALKKSTLLLEGPRGVTPASTDGGDPDDTPKILGVNPNDEEGGGEEDEETLHTVRLKIYKLEKKDGKPSWTDVGIGMLRLKKHKENGHKRMLSRNSSTGKIMMNFNLYKGLVANRNKQSLSFVGHENGANVTYRVRLKDEADATALKDAIDKEVASL